ncbi:MAG: mandelate racemase/muconate lactonizing enzyme family protein [Deltaproteobacteria bacterium]|nr:mandelate racemase/muconate lactonizing enzyme family protein [Deltaproteobacteria bacterium]MBW1959997.1 mandelate racemase/muconate lactonizing enzyme family protein [Deltaproteobacteria bacterium]MBW1995901.1 mandelate racemase/muconate lactonizing enzyme family protein [Deltaproteobacteria bacterium]MBW2153608.1 mandelate racemase/muconate lactonizing enzyme family protein [Deltaproteobacteria bacterium]
MKIEKIEAFPLKAGIEKPFRISTTTFREVSALIVQVTTDNGLTGIGESVVRTAAGATMSIVTEMLAPLIIGKDPMNIARLWWDMFSAMRTRGHTKGHFVEAISGIDVALWDIVSKAQDLPVYRALHGFGRKTLPAYGSSIFCDDVEKMAARAEEFLEMGYRAIKIKLGMGIRSDVEAVKAIRSSVGDDIALMVDANSRYDAATAIRIGRKLEPCDIDWFEEPVPPYDLKGYERVRKGQPLPVASGEGEFSLYGFRDLLSTGAVDILQPDIGRVGGFTEGMRIAALTQAYNLSISPHTGMFSALNVVVAMHYAAAVPNFLIFEFMEVDHPLMDIFKTPMIRPKGGTLQLPEKPGLGVELDMNKIKRYLEN